MQFLQSSDLRFGANDDGELGIVIVAADKNDIRHDM